MTSAPAIGFDYVPSQLLRRVLLLVAALTVLALMLCALPRWLQLVGVIVVSLATWRIVRRLAVPTVVAAGWSAEAGWTLRLADREDVPAGLISSRVLGGFVLLRLRTPEQGVQVLLLAPDNSDADIRRRLRMRLATIQSDEALPRL